MDNNEFQQAVIAQLQMLNTRFDKVDIRLDSLDARLDKVESKLDKVESRLDKVESRLDKVESRLDKVDARLDNLESGQAAIRKDIARLDNRIDTLSSDIGNAMIRLTENVDKEIIKLKIVK